MHDVEIIIVGGNHHNGLGLARILGINNYIVHSIVIDECKKSFLRFSKFISSCVCFKNEKEAYNYILTEYLEKDKYFIIPYSDGAAYELDKRLNEFKDFKVPSIQGKQGYIARMMEKSEQYKFANEHNIEMAKTTVIDFNINKDFESYNKEKFPCILKPIISAEGDKKDIRICYNYSELEKALKYYSDKDYKRAILQEYLKIDYEIDVFGCILKKEPYICLIPTKTIRSWPNNGGTNSFSKIIKDKVILEKCYDIINELRNSGFYGLYDIELFVIGNRIVLNEINYRNSGDVYMGINQKYYYPVAWIKDYLNLNTDISFSPNEENYAMTECADIRNVLKGNVSFNQWFKEFKQCRDFALKFKGDMKPAIIRYLYYFIQLLKFKKF